MVSVKDIKWGSYKDLEGPFFGGTTEGRFVLPAAPTPADEILYLTTVCEGGHYDAINMYDKGIVSVGLIQWIEGQGQFSVSEMLGALAEKDREQIRPVDTWCRDIGVAFRKAANRWRFTRDGDEIDTLPEVQKLFLLGSNGQKGTWDDASKAYAKQWAAALANVWSKPLAKKVQVEYTASRMLNFATKSARALLDVAPKNPVGSAFRSSYLSFAVNNPKWASEALEAAQRDRGNLVLWTPDWLIHVLKYLTFNAKISIYPHRYKAMRPALEMLYGLNLPDFAEDLKKWQVTTGHYRFLDPKEAQRALIKLGYDLGPAGADGVFGKKSQAALLDFETQQKIDDADGKMDPVTAAKLEAELHLRGIAL